MSPYFLFPKRGGILVIILRALVLRYWAVFMYDNSESALKLHSFLRGPAPQISVGPLSYITDRVRFRLFLISF